jgi:hypothetical protein
MDEVRDGITDRQKGTTSYKNNYGSCKAFFAHMLRIDNSKYTMEVAGKLLCLMWILTVLLL